MKTKIKTKEKKTQINKNRQIKNIKDKNKTKNNNIYIKKIEKIELYKEKSIEKIKEYFSLNSNYHYYIFNSCDATLYYALNCIISKKEINQINIPNQASWLSYEPLSNILSNINKNIDLFKYDFEHYEPMYSQLKNNTENQINIIQLLSGYLKQINIEEVPENSIIDASGFKNKINLSKFDCVILSFQHWKPINLGYGGFIAIKKNLDIQKKEKTYMRKILSIDRNPLEKTKISKLQMNFTLKTYKKLYNQLKTLEQRLYKFQSFFDKNIISIFNYLNKENTKYEIIFNNNSLNALIKTNQERKENLILIKKLKKQFKNIEFKNNISIRFKGISVEMKRFFK